MTQPLSPSLLNGTAITEIFLLKFIMFQFEYVPDYKAERRAAVFYLDKGTGSIGQL